INETTHLLVCGSWRIVGSWSNRPPQQKHHVLVLCGVVVSLVVPYLIQHAAVASFGVVVWLVGVGLLFGYCIVDASIL
ncbi:hypothetical protein QP411_09865, partial [Pseudoglutamicibacter cumminsii]|uniref:hypothetical protein n=1 Tax=Pseudoglutamicibacter cumminsii TaxID=156979 RepID=UPI002553DF5E